MDNRISATGLKNIDADTIEAQEIKVTGQTLIDETGLQVYHPYNLLLPLTPSGYWNVHDKIEAIQVENAITELELIQINTALGLTAASLSSVATITTPSAIAAGAGALFGTNALQGLLLKQGCKIGLVVWNVGMYPYVVCSIP